MIQSIKAMHKLICFIANEPREKLEGWHSSGYAPQFLSKVEWSCGVQHMVDKWFECDEDFVRFYDAIDDNCRVKLLTYCLIDYQGGSQLSV